jgi:hypothetical protein
MRDAERHRQLDIVSPDALCTFTTRRSPGPKKRRSRTSEEVEEEPAEVLSLADQVNEVRARRDVCIVVLAKRCTDPDDRRALASTRSRDAALQEDGVRGLARALSSRMRAEPRGTGPASSSSSTTVGSSASSLSRTRCARSSPTRPGPHRRNSNRAATTSRASSRSSPTGCRSGRGAWRGRWGGGASDRRRYDCRRRCDRMGRP